jgi:hypothetical protein
MRYVSCKKSLCRIGANIMIALQINPVDSKYYLYIRGMIETESANQFLTSSKGYIYGYKAHKAKQYNVIHTLDELVIGFENNNEGDILESSMAIANILFDELELV